jgi:ATP-binding cassette subfamily B protein
VLLGAVLLVGSAVFRGAFFFAQRYVGESLAQRVAFDIRNALYDRFQRLSFAFYDKAQTGQLMSRATADVEQVRQFGEAGLVRATNTVWLLGLSLFRLAITNHLLTFAVLPFLALMAGARSFSTRQRPLFLRTQNSSVNSPSLQEALSGIRGKAFVQEEQEGPSSSIGAEARSTATQAQMFRPSIPDYTTLVSTSIFSVVRRRS